MTPEDQKPEEKPSREFAVKMIEGLGGLNPTGDSHGSIDPQFTQACKDYDPDRETSTPLTLEEWRELTRGEGAGYDAPFARNIQDATDPFVFLAVLRDRLVHTSGCADNIIRIISTIVDPHIVARTMTWQTDEPEAPPVVDEGPKRDRTLGPCLDLEKLYSLKKNQALDYLYNEVDDALYAGHDDQCWPDIEALLEQADLDRMSLTLQVGFLTITLPVKTKLKARPAFYQKVRQGVLDNDPERADRLFSGLE